MKGRDRGEEKEKKKIFWEARTFNSCGIQLTRCGNVADPDIFFTESDLSHLMKKKIKNFDKQVLPTNVCG